MQKFKRHFDKEIGCKTPWAILEKKMIFVGRLTWVLHSKYDTPQERNEVLEKLLEEDNGCGCRRRTDWEYC